MPAPLVQVPTDAEQLHRIAILAGIINDLPRGARLETHLAIQLAGHRLTLARVPEDGNPELCPRCARKYEVRGNDNSLLGVECV